MMFVIWYLVGVIFSILGSAIIDKKVNVRDLCMSLTIGGLLGFIMPLLLLLFFIINEPNMGDKVIWKSKKGFTLIEVLIVIAIVGIVLAIVVPRFNEHQNKNYPTCYTCGQRIR